MLTIGGATPMEAVYGKNPPLLSDLETPSDAQADDDQGARSHNHRAREVVLGKMVETSAQARLARATRRKTRGAIESAELEVGDEVDYFRPAGNKDEPGWRGPAVLTEINDGQAVVRYLGRYHRVRAAELRRALMYLSFLMFCNTHEWGRESPVDTLIHFVESCHKHTVRLGWVQTERGWFASKANREFRDVLLAALYVAACCLHVEGCVGARVGAGVAT